MITKVRANNILDNEISLIKVRRLKRNMTSAIYIPLSKETLSAIISIRLSCFSKPVWIAYILEYSPRLISWYPRTERREPKNKKYIPRFLPWTTNVPNNSKVKMKNPSMNNTKPGMKKRYVGENININLKWRQPSLKLFSFDCPFLG